MLDQIVLVLNIKLVTKIYGLDNNFWWLVCIAFSNIWSRIKWILCVAWNLGVLQRTWPYSDVCWNRNSYIQETNLYKNHNLTETFKHIPINCFAYSANRLWCFNKLTDLPQFRKVEITLKTRKLWNRKSTLKFKLWLKTVQGDIRHWIVECKNTMLYF